MKKKLIYSFILFFLLLGVKNAFCDTFGIGEKIALENSISKRIEEIVIRMLGDKNIIVLVNVEHDPTVKQEVKNVSSLTPDMNVDNYLPGIPMDAVMGDQMTGSMGAFSQTVKLPEFIKSISITLLVSNKIEDAALADVREYVSNLMKLDTKRGDSLEIKKMAFSDKKEKMDFIKNTVINQLPWLIGIFLGTLFIFGPVRSFLKNLISAVEIFKVQADTRVVSRSEVGVTRQNEFGARELGAQQENAQNMLASAHMNALTAKQEHFNFINHENVDSLVYLLKEEKPEIIAIILTYLPKEHSNHVISSLPLFLRTETLKQMAVVKQYNGDEIREIEDRLREKVNYLLGGPQNISELIDTYEREEREKVLADIGREDNSIVLAIKSIMVTMDDLMKLSKESLYEVYKIVGTRIFAAALKDINEEVKNYVMSNLTEGARDMLMQEIDLIPVDIPLSRVNQAKKTIIAAMKRLEGQGTIKIPRETM